MKVTDILRILSGYKFSLSSEKILQEEICSVLESNSISFEREVKLSSDSFIDFLLSDIGVEVKIKGTAAGIYRQLTKYCASEKINAVILLTNRSMGVPTQINNKPVYVVHLGEKWL